VTSSAEVATAYSPAPDPSVVHQADLVLDTNVLLEQLSIADLDRAAERASDEGESEFWHRRQRARFSVLLAWHFHTRRYVTASLLEEVKRILLRVVPPENVTSPITACTTLVVHFLRPYVLHDWILGAFIDPPEGLTSTAADEYLLSRAKEERAPLITNEGNRQNGYVTDDPKQLPWKARRAGVELFTPEAFLIRKRVDFQIETRRFLNSYARAWPAARAEHESFQSQGMTEGAEFFFQILEGVLLDPVPDEFKTT
jgi:hypothetical protein